MMIHLRTLALLAVAILLAAVPAASADITIAQDGVAKATIVVTSAALKPPKNDLTAQKVADAASDLQAYVQKLSGAKLEVVGDDAQPAGPLILVGRSKLTAADDAHIPTGLTPDRKEEGFTVICKGDRLVLAGNDQGPYHGTEYAVSHLLHTLGVRWYMPGAYGEVIPHRPTLRIGDTNETQRPDFVQRNWWLHTTNAMAALERRWKIRNMMNPDNMWATPGDSSVRNYTADEKLLTTKPELFALTPDGKRDPHLPNLSNPEAVKIAADKMKEALRKDPQPTIGIAPDDGYPRDFNPGTIKLHQGFNDVYARPDVAADDSMSEEWFGFVNEVARDVHQEFPHVIVSTNGYANRDLPPFGVKLDPNLSVMYASIWADTFHAYDDPRSWEAVRDGQMLKRWCELNSRVWIYGYDYTCLVSALTPVPTVRRLARDYALMHQWGVAGFVDEYRNVWMEDGITRYVRARLEWDTKTDVKAMLGEYYHDWYGGAAKPAQEFWDTCEEGIQTTPCMGGDDKVLFTVYTPAFLAKLGKAVGEAQKLADTERARGHVEVDRLIYEHLLDYVAMNQAVADGRFAEAAQKASAMMAVRKQLHAINSFWVMPTERGDNDTSYDSGIWYWGVVARGQYYQKLADMASGKTGTLVAMLPEKARFRVDPFDEGRFYGWHLPAEQMKKFALARAETGGPDTPRVSGEPGAARGAAGWSDILTTRPFYIQGYLDGAGHPYTGFMWYRFEVDVPAAFKGRRVHLYIPTVETEAWAWVNGHYGGHREYHEAYERPQEFEVDATGMVEAGKKNLIVLRVGTTGNRAMMSGGMVSRGFLYSPEAKTPVPPAR